MGRNGPPPGETDPREPSTFQAIVGGVICMAFVVAFAAMMPAVKLSCEQDVQRAFHHESKDAAR